MYLSLTFLILFAISSYGSDVGPKILATKGEVWPKPQNETRREDYYIIKPHSFAFLIENEDICCPNFLDDAWTRYWTIIATSASLSFKNGRHWQSEEALEEADHFLGYLSSLNIRLLGECDAEDIFPALGDVEDYSIQIDPDQALLIAETIWVVLRGLETFSQLIYFDQDFLFINATAITDFPRFPHRGLLIDTSRHFQPVAIIFQMLDAMAYNKMNVFHWHLTDDTSFSYKSRTYPELSDKGAYHPVKTVYEQSDIKRIVEYARLRGIRVVPEFDTPGHTASWGLSHPELLTTCYTGAEPSGNLGPMDPTKSGTYEFLTKFFAEVVEVFPDSYLHIGGDEVEFDCWQSNSEVGTFMTNQNFSTYEELEGYFIQNLVDILDSLNSQYLVWEEVFANGVSLPNSTVVQIWRTNGLTALRDVVQSGKYGLYSSCWYLSDVNSGGDWETFYRCNPLLLLHEEDQIKRVLGGEAWMWGEYVNQFNIIPRVWPRASAVAERLWSDGNVKDEDDAARRLEEHSCRMDKRGIAAQPPNGPGVCL